MAGYFGTPLAKKLGIKEGARVLLVGAPAAFAIPGLPAGAKVSRAARSGVDVALVFSTALRALEGAFLDAAARTGKAGSVLGRLAEEGVQGPHRHHGGRHPRRSAADGMVDVKVCAIDETWSGLRFVLRKESR